MKRWKKILVSIATGFAIIGCLAVTALAAGKQTIYNSSYVTFAPDGQAWTTNAGDTNCEWYDKGTTVSTEITSSLRELETGEHYYEVKRIGEIPIGMWQVEWGTVNCCHNNYPPSDEHSYHGVPFNRNICSRRHYSGWNAYCADCGEKIDVALVYMSKKAAETIDYLEVGQEMNYYYLCPYSDCKNLEQGRKIQEHTCQAISWNQYKVVYNANAGILNFAGYMADSIHMYNNATEHNGKPVTPITHLTPNAYIRIGYEFVEWNTKPDGSGTSYQDGQEIFNLSTADWNDESTWTDSDEGTVVLYAQWRPSASTLHIDPNGGAYNENGDITSITDRYGSKYVLDGTITPPKGFTVAFEENGGNAVEDAESIQHFTEWSQVQPFWGRVKNNTYYFLAPDGNTDTMVANYEPGSVTLPEITKEGSSFGGWYYDAKFTRPAGGAGDTITPRENMTLYAQWVDLLLYAEDNYTANGGKGAVDLRWEQSDSNNKFYKLYQSRDNATWNQIASAEEIGQLESIAENFAFTGETATYRVPYSGVYTLTAYGAQGGNYDAYKGGYGGSVEAKVWLQKGEVLTYTIGGQNGYNGGGIGTLYGNGGGSTVIVSDLQGTLLVAGGGGGAGTNGDGEAGGSLASLREDESSEGASGQAGGGAGYVGGNAGEHIVHTCTDSCYKTESSTTNAPATFYSAGTYSSSGTGSYWPSRTLSSTSAEIRTHSGAETAKVNLSVGSAATYFSTPDTGTLSFAVHATNVFGDYSKLNLSISVYDKDTGKAIYTSPKSYGAAPAGDNFSVQCSVPISSTTKGVYIETSLETIGNSSEYGSWMQYAISNVSYKKTNVIKTCGYTNGQVISSKPGYGGSNYVNPTAALESFNDPGVREGDGAFCVESQAIGFVSENYLNDVVATDFAAPDKIAQSSVTQEAVNSSRVKVSWEQPNDNGTDYYHRAESFLVGSNSRLSSSNVTKNTLTAGIEGYYYVLNESPSSVVTSSDKKAENGSVGKFIKEAEIVVEIKTDVQYLHVAAVDKAGNVGDTVHICIDAKAVQWGIFTEQLSLEEGENVYPAIRNKTWYVRADGKTPFQLQHEAYVDGPVSMQYQPNYTIYESLVEGVSAQNIIYTSAHDIQDKTIRTDAKELSHYTEGQSQLTLYPYSYTVRTEQNRRLSSIQKFMLEAVSHGKEIKLIPMTGAEHGKDIVYSNRELDENNGITIIGDGEGPVISGMEVLKDKELLNRKNGKVFLNITAYDNLSGVADFYLEITNTDNHNTHMFTPDVEGNIQIEITADTPIFSGDFMITACAVDHVGNERIVEYHTTEFAMDTKVERILFPHDPVFKCGESGLLTITTWGYADYVEIEFPEEMTVLNPTLNQTYYYADNPQYKQESTLQFMIPLYMPTNTMYTITVRAYKGERLLEEFPCIGMVSVEGCALDDLRTRLR